MSMPRRVLFITRSLSSARGGMQLYTSVLTSELSARTDVRVSIVSFKGPKVLLPFFMSYAVVRGIFFRGDAVHIGDAALSPVGAFIHAIRPSLHLTLTTYGLDVTYPSRLYQAMLRFTLPSYAKIVAISNATAAELVARAVDPALIRVIPCGIRPPVSVGEVTRSSAPTLLLLGRQIKRKGTEWFLKNVFPGVLHAHPSTACVIVGDGPELPRIRSVVASSGLGKNIRVFGAVGDATRDRLYREATLFVMPNIAVPGDMEGFGLVCVEAAMHGLPVVAARMEGIQDAVIENVTGLFFAPGDAEDLLRAIDLALAKTWDRSSMIATSRDRFSAITMASRYVSDVL